MLPKPLISGDKMLGFAIVSNGAQAAERLTKIVDAFRTISSDARYDAGESCVLIYRTRYSNNYRITDGTGRIIVAAGTIMLGATRGNQALNLISKRLESGERLDSLYEDLRGPFSLLVIDPGLGTVALCTDRDGLMPCYEVGQSGSTIISSSLMLLAAVSDSPLDVLGVQEFVHGGAGVDGRTLFSDIHRVPAATISKLDGTSWNRRQLWKAAVHNPYLPDSDGEIVDRMHQLFSDALNIDLQDPKKTFAADLTAGTDSRTVLSFLLQSATPVVASTAGVAGQVDVERAKEIAKLAGIDHYWYPVEDTVEFDQASLDDCVEYSDGAMSPFGVSKQIPYFHEKSKRFDMLFGGNGGPLFKDHYWLFEFNRINRQSEPNWSRIARFSLTETRVKDDLFKNGVDYLDHMKALFMKRSSCIRGTNNQKLDFIYFDLKCQSFAAPQFSFSNRFMDVYHPMCDGKLVEYSMSIRPWIRQRARLQSELIYRNNKDIAWALTDNYVPCVPDTGWRAPLRFMRAIRYARAVRRKINDFVLNKKQVAADNRAVTFVRSLLATDLRGAFEDPEKMRIAPLLNSGTVKQMCSAVASGAHSGYLQRLFAVEAILRKVEAAGQRTVRVPQA